VTPTRLMLLCVLFVAGCAASKARNAYLRSLDDQTDKLLVYRGVGTALRLRGTYLSPGFREVLSEERRRLVGPTEQDHQAFVERMTSDATAYHDVVFTAESDIQSRVAFGEADGLWRIRLVADGVAEKLISVHHVRRPTPLHEELYAHKNLWNELWIARFERTVTNPEEIRFHVGSGYGNNELVWTGDQVR